MAIKVLNKRLDPIQGTTVNYYIGRGSIFGNPYSHKTGTKAEFVVESRDAAVSQYMIWFKSQVENNPEFKRTFEDLIRLCSTQDVNLICYCKPLKCHGDFLKVLIEKNLEKNLSGRK